MRNKIPNHKPKILEPLTYKCLLPDFLEYIKYKSLEYYLILQLKLSKFVKRFKNE